MRAEQRRRFLGVTAIQGDDDRLVLAGNGHWVHCGKVVHRETRSDFEGERVPNSQQHLVVRCLDDRTVKHLVLVLETREIAGYCRVNNLLRNLPQSIALPLEPRGRRFHGKRFEHRTDVERLDCLEETDLPNPRPLVRRD